MYPARIDSYHRATSVADALAALTQHGEGAAFIAGGQSLMQAVKSRLVQPTCLVDLQDVGALKGVSSDGKITIGAMTRYVDLAGEAALAPSYAAINDAAAHVGDRQVRNRGTIGGSLCWNYIAACMPAVALGLGAQMHLVSPNGERRVAADDFLGGPLETDRQEDEILQAVELASPPAKSGSAYKKWALLTDGLPVVGVCVYVECDAGGSCTSARVAFGGLASGPARSARAEAALVGRSAGDAAGVEAAMSAAADEMETQGDLWADPDYRKQLIRSLGSEVATLALQRASA
ncbi:MAG: xanthine dehydrogenase family protein subunit M [Rhodospirillales bacterium]